MHVSGVNFHIPHSFNPRAPRDTDCPPYFYNGGFEPRWPLYRVHADYTSRLSVMLSGGRHVCPVALLFVGNSAHVGRYVAPDQISEALQDALFDCDWIPYEVFENDMAVGGRELKLRSESYKILVVPPVEVIPYATLAKAKGILRARRRSRVARFSTHEIGDPSARPPLTSLRCVKRFGVRVGSGSDRARLTPAGGRSYLLPEKPTAEQLQQVFAGDAGVHPTLEVIEGRTDRWLHVLHRVKSGCDVFFVANQNHEGAARRFRFRIAANGVPECWGPDAQTKSPPCRTCGAKITWSWR